MLTKLYLARTFVLHMTKRTIQSLISEGVPKARVARRIGITRQDLYAFLDPTSYTERCLADETLGRIAEFEGRSLASVRGEYLSRKAA